MKFTELLNVTENILVKMEMNNISGSHKYRAANYIIETGINNNLIHKDTTIIEKTGGNFGFGLLAACLKRNISVELAIGLNFSQEKKDKLQKLGARLIGQEMLEAGKTPKEVVEWHLNHQQKLGKNYFYTDQFNNSGSYLSHLETGNEISIQLKQDYPQVKELIFVGCAGTGASFTGVSEALIKNGYKLKTVLVEPSGCDSKNNVFTPHNLEGMSVGVCPPFLKWNQIDMIYHVADHEINEVKKEIFSSHGVLVGNTSAACYKAASSFQDQCNPSRKILTFFYDSGIWYK
ncbi:pyridoxal-phosphate dependent enzyme [Acinetobacter shaoyimingii]|uniref:cysteine synthase n=1 Tax=Acinetobacter shaoyimingii TaxID=2715164 RepID=A0A6G8RYF6_9GAMM|nr:pyridoxal-phosphate dependent enzyme [Acinetobacter shaoyimingii]QIO06982.1 pyridoxal-phosphate dependent enzyme [Acinetobacter shaoyimingii]